MPEWVYTCCEEYFRRFPPEWSVKVVELPLEKRRKSQSTAATRKKETQRLLEAVPEKDWLVVLDEKGTSFSTERFARRLERCGSDAHGISFMIGGPDGIDFSVDTPRRKCWPDLRWSLSELTFPHPLVRVLLAEQLYRVWSVNAGHPYHRS